VKSSIGLVAALGALSVVSSPASANDTMAELKTGGLIFVRSDVVAMEKEDLYISPDEVRVAYVFRNTSDEDVEAIVAFPMPAISGNPYSDVAVPDSQSDNFLNFSVDVDGRGIRPELEQKAFAAEIDVTGALVAARVPLNPYAEDTYQAIERLPQATRDDWVARGILYRESYDDGSGWQEHDMPYWSMRSTYWWRMNFPAGEPVDVRHRYQPSVGGTSGLNFFYDGKVQGPVYEEYKVKYCLDDSIVRAVERTAKQTPEGWPPYWENWISYILKTGANWSTTIHDFRLVIDKGEAGNLVSFCGTDVKKIGPTTFEMRAQDFYPDRDIDILLLRRFDADRDVALEPEPQAERSREKKPLKPQ
jgi:hypothetical protein